MLVVVTPCSEEGLAFKIGVSFGDAESSCLESTGSGCEGRGSVEMGSGCVGGKVISVETCGVDGLCG